jgi:hypothetical protein
MRPFERLRKLLNKVPKNLSPSIKLLRCLPLRRDFVAILLIFILAVASQFFGAYSYGQIVATGLSTPQPQLATSWFRRLDDSPTSIILSGPLQAETQTNIVPFLPPILHTPSPSSATPTPSVTPSPSPYPTPSPTPSSTPSPTPSPSPTPPPTPSNISLGLYQNNPSLNQSQVLLNIDWSSMTPGQEKNSSVAYIKNEGDLPFTMSLSTSNWVFEDSAGNSLSQNYSQYFKVTWNYDNTPLKVNEVRPVIFTLAVSSNLTDVASFSFDLVVTITSTM